MRAAWLSVPRWIVKGLISVLVGTMVLAACAGDPDPENPHLTIEGGDVAIVVGESRRLIARVPGGHQADVDVAWVSSDSSIVSVDAGWITGIAVGSADVTASGRIGPGTSSDTASVTVRAAGGVEGDVEGDGEGDGETDDERGGAADDAPPVDPEEPPAVEDPPWTGAPDEPVVPAIRSFVAEPRVLLEGEVSVLSWEVSGAFERLYLTSDTSGDIIDDLEASGSITATPAATTRYTLVVVPSGALVDPRDVLTSASVDIMVEAATPARIDHLRATVVRGSRVELAWTPDEAASIEVHAIADDDATEPLVLAHGLPGTTTSLTIPIPSSERQTIRVIARRGSHRSSHDAFADTRLENVVTDEGDDDERFADAPRPGTLRNVLELAAPGAVIGFAADISLIDLVGVDSEAGRRAHLLLGASRVAGQVTISGPDWTGSTAPRVTLRSDPRLAFEEKSGIMMVWAGSDVTLENLRLTGGTFTRRGGAVHNEGRLSIEGSLIDDNRAWGWGGGLYNEGTLTISHSIVRDNTAAVLEHEQAAEFCVPQPTGPCAIMTLSDGGAGGGLQNINGTVTIRDSVFEGNHAKYSGGGLCNYGGSMVIIDTDFDFNSATSEPYPSFDFPNRGGGVYSTRFGSMTMVGGRLHANHVDGIDGLGGGASLRFTATMSLRDVSVTSNSASRGGGIFTETTIGEPVNYALTDVEYSGNVAVDRGSDVLHYWTSSP